MAIETIMLESFDAYDVVTNDMHVQGKWTARSISGADTLPRTGTKCLGVVVSTIPGWFTKDLDDDWRMLIVGFALRLDVLPDGTAGSGHFLQLRTGTYIENNPSTQVSLSMNTSGYLQVYRGTPGSGTLLQTSTTTQFAIDTWYYIEFKCYIDNTSGAYEVEVDGAAEMSGTSVDTQAHASSNIISNIIFYQQDHASNPGSTYTRFDDIYIRGDKTTDTAGGLLGPVQIHGLQPDANGNHRDWTRSTGSDDYTLVDELGAINKTDYLYSATDTNKLTCGFEDLPADRTAEVVQLVANCEITDRGGRDLLPLCRTGGTTYSGAAQDVLSLGNYHVWDTNPAGGSWSKAAVDGAEFGTECS